MAAWSANGRMSFINQTNSSIKIVRRVAASPSREIDDDTSIRVWVTLRGAIVCLERDAKTGIGTAWALEISDAEFAVELGLLVAEAEAASIADLPAIAGGSMSTSAARVELNITATGGNLGASVMIDGMVADVQIGDEDHEVHSGAFAAAVMSGGLTAAAERC